MMHHRILYNKGAYIPLHKDPLITSCMQKTPHLQTKTHPQIAYTRRGWPPSLPSAAS